MYSKELADAMKAYLDSTEYPYSFFDDEGLFVLTVHQPGKTEYIDYGIFAQSFKSEIVNLQSIGRGLLKTDEKDTFYLYDMVDWLPTKKLYTQGLAKIKTYKDKKFEYNIINK